ncbi:MAG TPA: hypothetical protein ENJ37_02910 [Deltaproteobacteria bacterium]|nr:hypothetical protein [Deltaproteobacteria bacterium]
MENERRRPDEAAALRELREAVAAERKKNELSTRRSMLKSAALGALALVTTGTLAKKVADKAVGTDAQRAYLADIVPGDAVWKARRFVLMTDGEKRALVRKFEDDYRKRRA